jgi:hypothetical protein
VIALSGCATEPTKSAPVVTRVVTERVEIPLRVPCVKAADVPPRPKMTAVDIAKADTRQLAAALAADVLAYDLYADRVDALLKACAR